MTELGFRNKKGLSSALVALAMLILVGAGIVLGNQLGRSKPMDTMIVRTPTPLPVQATVTLTARDAAGAGADQPARTAVTGGMAESDTGTAVLLSVALRSDRRYILQVTSRAGALDFSGSYGLGSIDPKVVVEPVRQISGTATWEQEIQPPATGARSWNFGASVSARQAGKHIKIQVWDAGPR